MVIQIENEIDELKGEIKMNNVFETAKSLNFILPSDVRLDKNTKIPMHEISIIIYLYYMDTVDYYFEYIKRIPKEVDVYISFSSDSMREQIQNYINENQLHNCQFVMKENRGRDISALLVACRKIALQYKYICFVHDKKGKNDNEIYNKEIKIWIEDMWMNTVLSADYIYNIINLLDKNKSLGLLVPPEMVGYKLMFVYHDTWGENFENTVKLAKELKLNCNLQKEFPPITLGTVFWARTRALDKLLEKEWRYEDFVDEPLPDDGTISHAIERILSYVAQDAGFDTGYVIADKFAESYIIQLKDVLRNTYKELNAWDITFLSQLQNYIKLQNRVLEFMKNYNTVYFYGAGMVGRIVYWLVLNKNKAPDGFLVSKKKENEDTYFGLPVYDIREAEISDTTGIVITVSENHVREVIQQLENRNIKEYIICFRE